MRSATFGRRLSPPSSPGASPFVDRRRCPRRHLFEPARIVLDQGAGDADCIIRDISDGGAGLRLHDGTELPDEFVLEAETTAKRLCRVVWRSDLDVGVAFA